MNSWQSIKSISDPESFLRRAEYGVYEFRAKLALIKSYDREAYERAERSAKDADEKLRNELRERERNGESVVYPLGQPLPPGQISDWLASVPIVQSQQADAPVPFDQISEPTDFRTVCGTGELEAFDRHDSRVSVLLTGLEFREVIAVPDALPHAEMSQQASRVGASRVIGSPPASGQQLAQALNAVLGQAGATLFPQKKIVELVKGELAPRTASRETIVAALKARGINHRPGPRTG